MLEVCPWLPLIVPGSKFLPAEKVFGVFVRLLMVKNISYFLILFAGDFDEVWAWLSPL